jgi:serine protease
VVPSAGETPFEGPHLLLQNDVHTIACGSFKPVWPTRAECSEVFMIKHAALALTVIFLAACSGGNTNPGGGGSNGGPDVISGQIRLSNNITSATEPLENIIPGEVIVKFKAGLRAQGISSLSVKGSANQTLKVNRVRSLALEGSGLYRTNSLDQAGTLEMVRQLEARSDVEYAQPNRRLQAADVPTPSDTYFSLQWDLQPPAQVAGGMNITGAWNAYGTGTAGTVVAVVDTGILFEGNGSSKTHPDLIGRVLPGYDFISDPGNAGDGDGRDPNPFDPGDDDLTYHGSHVAGTILASANNGGTGFNGGIVGINWAAKLLPVRVLGKQNGTTVDIVEGTLWAAGLPINGVPNNPTPADVINLSLSGQGSCGPAEQEAYAQALNAPQKPIIIVAAGNNNKDASGFSPGSCAGLITVGATDQFGTRASYSNFGPRIDVMAPGGDSSQAFAGHNNAGGILSLHVSPNGELDYVIKDGTSMAAPHVAGLASLIKGLKPNLNTAEVLGILKRPGVASTLNAAKCKRPQGTDCGVGLLEAKLALDAAINATNTPDFTFAVSSTTLPIAPGGTGKVSLTANRQNGLTEAINLSIPVPVAGLTTSFTAAGTDRADLNITAAANLAPGLYPLTIRATTAGGLSKSQTLSLQVRNASDGPDLQGTLVLTCIRILGKCANNTTVGVQITSATRQANYTLTGVSSSGTYVVLAYKDTNGNQLVDNGDFIGAYLTADRSDLAQVRPPKASVSFDLERAVSVTSLETALETILPTTEMDSIRGMLETYLAANR